MAYNIKGLIKLIRPHDYIKNLFIFAPLFFSGEMSMALFFNALIAFVAFSAGASAVYILNDYQDIEHDRQHPKKRLRPLASGTVTKAHALCLMLILFIFSITLANSLSIFVLAYICTYLLLNVAYSFYLKNIAILDIAVIAIGFVLRLFVGAMATHVALSMWIVMMTFLLALFLALAKRRHDMLIFINTGNKMREVISGYNIRFIDRRDDDYGGSDDCILYSLYNIRRGSRAATLSLFISDCFFCDCWRDALLADNFC